MERYASRTKAQKLGTPKKTPPKRCSIRRATMPAVLVEMPFANVELVEDPTTVSTR